MIAMWTLLLALTCHAQTDSPPGMVVSADYRGAGPLEVEVAPGQIVTLFVHGISKASIGGRFPYTVFADGLPLPYTLEGISVTANWQGRTLEVPLLAVGVGSASIYGNARIAFIALQVPYEVTSTWPRPGFAGRLNIYEEGELKAWVPLVGTYSKPHILAPDDTLRTTLPGYWGVRHADGFLVTKEKPAKPGEALTMYAVGLGNSFTQATRPKAGEPAPEGYDVPLALRFTYGLNPQAEPVDYPCCLPPPQEELVSARMVPGKVGLYEVVFRVPREIPAGTAKCGLPPPSWPPSQAWSHNVMVSIGFINLFVPPQNNASYDSVGICVEVPHTE